MALEHGPRLRHNCTDWRLDVAIWAKLAQNGLKMGAIHPFVCRWCRITFEKRHILNPVLTHFWYQNGLFLGLLGIKGGQNGTKWPQIVSIYLFVHRKWPRILCGERRNPMGTIGDSERWNPQKVGCCR